MQQQNLVAARQEGWEAELPVQDADSEFYAAMRAINPAPGVFFFRLQLLTA